MSTATPHPSVSIARTLRTIALASAIVALVAGLLILVWPLKTAVAITVLVALYALVQGVVTVAAGIRARTLSGGLRAATVVLGVLFVVAGVVAFANLASTTAFIATVVSTLLGIAWIVEGVVTLSSVGGRRPGDSVVRSRGWTIAFAVLSVLAGVVVILSPLWTALWLWLFIGASLVVFGVVHIVRAARLER